MRKGRFNFLQASTTKSNVRKESVDPPQDKHPLLITGTKKLRSTGGENRRAVFVVIFLDTRGNGVGIRKESIDAFRSQPNPKTNTVQQRFIKELQRQERSETDFDNYASDPTRSASVNGE